MLQHIFGAFKLFLLCESISLSYGDNVTRKFPQNFIFGVSSAAFPTEGGWDADGEFLLV